MFPFQFPPASAPVCGKKPLTKRQLHARIFSFVPVHYKPILRMTSSLFKHTVDVMHQHVFAAEDKRPSIQEEVKRAAVAAEDVTVLLWYQEEFDWDLSGCVEMAFEQRASLSTITQLLAHDMTVHVEQLMEWCIQYDMEAVFVGLVKDHWSVASIVKWAVKWSRMWPFEWATRQRDGNVLEHLASALLLFNTEDAWPFLRRIFQYALLNVNPRAMDCFFPSILLKTAFVGCCLSDRASDCVLFTNFHAFIKKQCEVCLFVTVDHPLYPKEGCAGWAKTENGAAILSEVKAGVECACLDGSVH